MEFDKEYRKTPKSENKASAECIRFLTEKIKVLEQENKNYKEVLEKYQKDFEELEKKNCNEEFKGQLKKIEGMNLVLRKKIEKLKIHLEVTREKDVGTAKNVTEYYQEYISKLMSEKQEFEKKAEGVELLRSQYKRIEEKYKNAKAEVFRLRKISEIRHSRKSSGLNLKELDGKNS